MTAGFGEINILCTEIDASLAFYGEGLGLEEIERESAAVRLRFGPITLLLMPYARNPRTVTDYEREATISFDAIVDDVEAAVARLEGLGGRRVVAINGDEGWAVADPDGNIIEVIRAEDSP